MIDTRLRWALPAAVVAAWLVWYWPGQAAESRSGLGGRIEFSEFELPRGLMRGDDDLQDRRRGQFVPIERGSSVGGVVEALPAMPSVPGSPAGIARMQELLDQRRNWIYATEPDTGLGLTADQVLGVRSYEFDLGSPASTRGGWLGFGQGDRRGQVASQPRNPLFDTSRDELALDTYLLDGLDGSGAMGFWEPGWAAGSSVSGSGGTLSGGTSLLPMGSSLSPEGAVGGPEFGARSRDRRVVPGSLRDLLAPPDALAPFGGDFDPIQLRIDTTRQELNPSAPQRWLDLSLPRRPGDVLMEGMERRGSSSGSGLDFMESVAPVGVEAGSLAPVTRAPPEPQGSRPVLRFGEFPSRSF
jgi:hypothetical protein